MTVSAATSSVSSSLASQYVSSAANSTSSANFADLLTKAENEKNQSKVQATASSEFSALTGGNGSSSALAAMLINGNSTISQVASSTQNSLSDANILG